MKKDVIPGKKVKKKVKRKGRKTKMETEKEDAEEKNPDVQDEEELADVWQTFLAFVGSLKAEVRVAGIPSGGVLHVEVGQSGAVKLEACSVAGVLDKFATKTQKSLEASEGAMRKEIEASEGAVRKALEELEGKLEAFQRWVGCEELMVQKRYEEASSAFCTKRTYLARHSRHALDETEKWYAGLPDVYQVISQIKQDTKKKAEDLQSLRRQLEYAQQQEVAARRRSDTFQQAIDELRSVVRPVPGPPAYPPRG